MKTRLQRGAGASQPLWMRTLACVCLLLISVASTVQAVHLHGDLLPHHAAQVGQPADESALPGGELRCDLCMAMHSAMPVTAQTPVLTLTVVASNVAMVADRLPVSAWHFASFSRPPPVVRNA